MSTPGWIHDLFQTIDTNDTAALASFLTHDATFVFANAEPVKGKGAIRETVAAFLASIKAIRHDVLETWEHPDAVICHGVVTYTRHDESQLRVPFANIFKMQGSLIRDYLIYVDASRVICDGVIEPFTQMPRFARGELELLVSYAAPLQACPLFSRVIPE